MKRFVISFILLILFATKMQQAVGQSEKFDIITYTPPAGWQKETRQSYVSFITVNQTTGSFCHIVLYAGIPGSGSPEKDFEKEWNDLVVTPYQAEKKPQTGTQTNADGWQVTAGAAPVQKNDISSYIILTVLSGFNKTISVLANLNDQGYISEIDKFLNNIKPDKPSSNNMSATTSKGNDQADKFGQMIFTAPGGWKVTKYQDAVVIKAADLPEKESIDIQIMPAMIFSGTMEQALDKSYNEICNLLQLSKMNNVDGKNFSSMEAKKSFRGWEYIRCSGGVKANNGTPYPDEYGLDLFVIKVNNRFERVAVIKSRNTCNGLSSYYPTDRQQYQNIIENFLYSLKFDDWREPVVSKGSVNGNGITGIWQGLSMSVGLAKPGAELGAELKARHLILFSNGQVYFGKNFPVEGLDELNTWIKAENNRRDWGTYSFSNGKGTLKMPYGNIPVRLENNKLIITTNKTDHGFIKLNSVDDAKFNGTYTLSEWNGIIPSISFSADGKFTDKGAIRVLYHEYIDCLNPGISSGSGYYEIKNHSVIFKYSDGRKIKIAFTGTGFNKNNSSPPTLLLSFNEDILKKQ